MIIVQYHNYLESLIYILLGNSNICEFSLNYLDIEI